MEPSVYHATTPRPKKQIKISKKVLLVFCIGVIFLTMLTGISIMDNKTKRKVQGIWLTMPTIIPVPSNTPTLTLAPTIDPTANWILYANKSIQIKYPPRFSIQEKEISYNTLYPKIYSAIELYDGIDTITITVAKNSANFSINTISGNGPNIRYAKNLLNLNSQQITKIDNADALINLRIPSGSKGVAKEILILNKQKVYQLTLAPLDNDTAVFDLIQNSIKLLDQEPADITDNWSVYTNNYYGYLLKYPSNYIVEHEKNATISALTVVFDERIQGPNPSQFKLEAQDLKNITLSNFTSRSYLSLPLSQYVQKKWEYNKATNSAYPNKTVSNIQETSIAGRPAYQFTVTDEYRDDRITEQLSAKNIIYFTENSGYKFKIWFPETDNTLKEVLKTIIFVK